MNNSCNANASRNKISFPLSYSLEVSWASNTRNCTAYNSLVLLLNTVAMGKATRSKINMEHMEEAIAKLASNQLHVTSKLDDLIQRITMLESNQHHSPAPSSSSANPQTPSRSSSFPRMKLEVPRFDGSDPSGWTFKINQFFDYHSTPEPECLIVASFAMEGPTLAWFQWLTCSVHISILLAHFPSCS